MEINLEEIMGMNPNNEAIIHHTFEEIYEGCYWQYEEDKQNKDDVSEFDEEVHNESGWGDMDRDNKESHDPKRIIHEYDNLEIIQESTFRSKTFIGLIQNEIKSYLDENEDERLEYMSHQFLNNLDIFYNCEAFQDLAIKLKCDDYKLEKNTNSESDLLWWSYYELREANIIFEIQEI